VDYTFVEGSTEEVVSQFERSNVVSFDLETTGLSPLDSRILLLQLGFPHHSYVIDSRADVEPIMPFLASPRWIKLIHNAKFEHRFIQHQYDTFIRNVYDTMLAEQVLGSEKFARGLAFVAEKYTGYKMDKTQQKSFIDMKPGEMFSAEQLRYAAKDVDILFAIYEKQKDELDKAGLTNIAQIEFEAVGAIAAMENEGIPVDTQAWRNKLAEYKERYRGHRDNLFQIFFDSSESKMTEQLGIFERGYEKNLNLNSPAQVTKALASIGINVHTTNERELSRIDHPATKELLKYRGVEKILTSYGENFLSHIHPFTNRLHPDFNQIGAETGRMSCREPNVQQIPDEFRGLVGNVKDYKIVGADYSQMELRIIAEISQDPALIRAFSTGDDPHKSTAAIMFNIPLDAVTKEQRYIAKTINFGLAYGMGDDKLGDMLNEGKSEKDKLGPRKIEALYTQYRTTYSRVMAYFAQSGALALSRGFSETLGGRKRYFIKPSGILDQESVRKQLGAIRRAGGNAPIQGTNADITKLALARVHDEFLSYGFNARIINAVHDEIVVLAHKSQAESVKEVVADAMLSAGKELIKSVPVVVDPYVSNVWKK
jgi:DNA polymerase-1